MQLVEYHVLHSSGLNVNRVSNEKWGTFVQNVYIMTQNHFEVCSIDER